MITKEDIFKDIDLQEGDKVFLVIQNKDVMRRVAYGYDAITLLAVLAYLQADVIDQIKGVNKPDIRKVTKTVLVDDEPDGMC